MRAAITGAGVVTPIGIGLEAFAASLRAGRQRLTQLTGVPIPRGKASVGVVEGPEFDGDARAYRLACHAVRQAIDQAGLRAPLGDDTALILSTLTSDARAIEFKYADFAAGSAPAERTRPLLPLFCNGTLAHALRRRWQMRGPQLIVSNACASGNIALGLALEMIRHGRCRAAVICGVELVTLGMLWGAERAGFIGRALRPFHRERDGSVLGEGAGAIVLRHPDDVDADSVLGWMEGFGCGVDLGAAPITLLADGSGLLRGMSMALEDGGRSPADVHYINAHAPGTPLIDGLECRAIRNLLPPASAPLPSINSTKSLTSHMSAASAIVDVVATLLQMRDGFVHPHAGLDDPDPELAIPVVGAETIERSVTIALSNACGGGGLNTSVLITAPRTAPCSPATASQSAAYTGTIVMTGLGGITPWWSDNHAACSRAHDGAAPGRLEALDITRWYPSSTGYSYMNRAGQLGAIAGYLAIDGTCIQKRYAPDRVAVLSGTLLGGAPEASAVMNEALTHAPETIRPSMALDHGVHLSTALVRRYFDFNGFTYTFTGSCAGGLQATAVAADLLRTRRADAVVVIGHDALDVPLQRAAPWLADCLPADRLTEGGAAVVFERDEEGRGHAMMPAAALEGTLLLTTEAGHPNAPADQDDAALDAMADRLLAGLPGLTWDTVYLAGPRRKTLDRLAARLVDRYTRQARQTRQAAASHAHGGEAYGMAADAMICLVSAAARRERALVLALDPFGVLAAAVVAPAA